jgi:HSP20 family protein
MTMPVRRGRYGMRRRDPFGGWGFDNLFEQMNRMLSGAFPDMPRITVKSWSPPVDVQENDNEYVIEADVPGVPEEAVRVNLHGRELRITGEFGAAEKGAAEQAEGEQPTTRRTGRFDYRVNLPGEVNAETCNADLENGVLRLRLPKVAPTAGRRIPVQVSRHGASAPTGEAGAEGEATPPGRRSGE